MIRSMTGYGTSSKRRDQAAVSVEIRTGNHRFLDPHVRLPREYAYLEPDVTQILRAALARGRVDLYATVQARPDAGLLLDFDTARNYVDAGARLREELNLGDSLDLRTLLGLPGVLQNRDAATLARPQDTSAAELLVESVREAVQGVVQMREAEGLALVAEMRQYLQALREKLEGVRRLAPRVVEEYRRRLSEKLAQVLPDSSVDPQRLAQEVALVAEKSDITEEVARLESHLDQCAGLVTSTAPVGKELDFLMQEMHREVNTILSKSGAIEITRLAIAMKGEVEKLREQVQNVE
jgi:uncharacterized protein (TIGR00255 family)